MKIKYDMSSGDLIIELDDEMKEMVKTNPEEAKRLIEKAVDKYLENMILEYQMDFLLGSGRGEWEGESAEGLIPRINSETSK